MSPIYYTSAIEVHMHNMDAKTNSQLHDDRQSYGGKLTYIWSSTTSGRAFSCKEWVDLLNQVAHLTKYKVHLMPFFKAGF